MRCQVGTMRAVVALCLIFTVAKARELYDHVPGFKVEVLHVPEDCDYRAQTGDLLKKHYNGTLTDGTLFDSSHQRGRTYNFNIGLLQVIDGMERGAAGVCKGEKRRITIPPSLGYGSKEKSKIPANSTLIFEIEIMDVVKSAFRVETLYMPDECDRKTAPGDLIKEHYNGTFKNGTQFHTSYNRDKPYEYRIGEGRVIKGIDIGLLNMCIGEVRKISIPWKMAYARKGWRDIVPPYTDVIYYSTVLDIVKGRLKSYKLDGPVCDEDEQVQRGDEITVVYHGVYETGYKFSSNGEERKVRVEDANVLEGFTEGVKGMCINERRRLRVPPEMVIGDLHNEQLPQNIRVSIDVEITGIKKSDLFNTIDTNKDGYLCEEEVEIFLKDSGEFADRMQDFKKAKVLIDFHFNERDSNRDGWVNRREFYGEAARRDEL